MFKKTDLSHMAVSKYRIGRDFKKKKKTLRKG